MIISLFLKASAKSDWRYFKAESDICCTSSNAVEIVKKLNEKEVLFVPDTYLGKWVEKQLTDVKVITYNGFCPTHLRVFAQDVELSRQNHPNAKVLAHPECHHTVTNISDLSEAQKKLWTMLQSQMKKNL